MMVIAGNTQRPAASSGNFFLLTFACPARRLLLVLLIAAASQVEAAAAHELRPAIGTFSLPGSGQARLELSLNLEAALAEISAEHENTEDSPQAQKYDALRRMTPNQIEAEIDRFEPVILRRIAMTIDGEPLAFKLSGWQVPEIGDVSLPRVSALIFDAIAPGNPRQLSWRFDPLLGDSVMRLRDPRTNKIVRAEVIAAGESGGPAAIDGLVPQGKAEVFAAYVKQGFLHILPKGLDHILFVLGLFLLSSRMKVLLWQISAFTLAHTVTLGMAASGMIAVSPAIVEPLIALSIVYIGVENVMTDRLRLWRPPVVFGFGLLHGLGFAGVLGGIGLPQDHFWTSLAGFNIGVEIGQLAVIAIAAGALGWAMRMPWYRKSVSVPASLAISAIALYWTVERLMPVAAPV